MRGDRLSDTCPCCSSGEAQRIYALVHFVWSVGIIFILIERAVTALHVSVHWIELQRSVMEVHCRTGAP